MPVASVRAVVRRGTGGSRRIERATLYITVRERAKKPVGETGAALPSPGRRTAERVAGTVVLLGLVSLLTDVSSEMVASVLPLYLTTQVGLSYVAYGVVDGVYQGASAFVRIFGGYAADRWGRPKWVAVVGYGVSAVSRLLMLGAHSLPSVTGVVTADRLGKGLRTAPRDALIADVSEPAVLGRAFGVHRALDTIGAALGPLVAFGLLASASGTYHSVFVVSFGFALLGVAVLVVLVPNRRTTSGVARQRIGSLLRQIGGPRLRRPLVVAALLGLFTIGDSFLYLTIQDRDGFGVMVFPLLFVGTNAAYLALAIPMGRLADRVGRARVFVAGHVALLLAYLTAAASWHGTAAAIVSLLLLGTFYAATDGVLAALTSRLSTPESRGTGIAAAQTVVVVSRFAASVGFGALWAVMGAGAALLIVSTALVVAIPVAMIVLRNVESEAETAESDSSSEPAAEVDDR
jgi:MFS family permease